MSSVLRLSRIARAGFLKKVRSSLPGCFSRSNFVLSRCTTIWQSSSACFTLDQSSVSSLAQAAATRWFLVHVLWIASDTPERLRTSSPRALMCSLTFFVSSIYVYKPEAICFPWRPLVSPCIQHQQVAWFWLITTFTLVTASVAAAAPIERGSIAT